MDVLSEKSQKRRKWLLAALLPAAAILIMAAFYLCNIRNTAVEYVQIIEGGTNGQFTAQENAYHAIRLSCDSEAASFRHQETVEFDKIIVSVHNSDDALIWQYEQDDCSIPVFQFSRPADLEDNVLLLEKGETYYIRYEVQADTENLPDDPGQLRFSAALAGGSRNLSGLYLYFCMAGLLAAIAAGALITAQNIRTIRLLSVFLIFLFGVMNNMAMKPLSVPDEGAHFGYTYNMSSALLGLEHPVHYNPAGLTVYQSGLMRDLPSGNMLQDTYLFWTQTEYGSEPVKAFTENFRGDTNYVTYEYAPQILLVTLARLMHLPYQFIYLMGRLGTLLAYIILVYAGMRICPFMTCAIAGISILPSVSWIVSSFSYDGWNLGFCILFVCLCISMQNADNLHLKDLLVLLICFAAFVPIKYIYIVLGFMIFALPLKKALSFQLKAFLTGGGIAAIGFAAIKRGKEIIGLLTTSMTDDRGLAQGLSGEAYTISWAVRHAGEVVLVFIKTIIVSADSILKKMIVGEFNAQVIPALLTAALFIVFILLMCRPILLNGESTALKDGGHLYTGKAVRSAWLTFLLGVFAVLAAFLFLYSYHREGETGTIGGLQGRYFFPFLILLPVMLGKDTDGGDAGVCGINNIQPGVLLALEAFLHLCVLLCKMNSM